jgi:bifunctional non-homologous end joining protein LigD
LFLKRRDGLERPDTDITLEDRSVLSGLSIADLEQGLLPRRPASQLAPTAEHVERARRLAFPSPYEPMLPTPSHTVPQSTNWLYEAELAGSRVLAFVNHGKVHLRSRGDCYPEIVRTLAALPVDQAVFDGEVVTGLKYDVFDLLYLDGFDLRSVPLTERKLLLHGVLAPLGGLEEVGVFDDGTQLRQAAQQQGLEGIVAKKRDSVYEAGARVRTWLTVKTSIPTRDRYTCAAR